ncbi:nucleotide exchange factor GrpE [Chloroflexota bacterium]
MSEQKEPEEEFDNEIEFEAAEDDVTALKQSLDKERERAESNLANWQRAQADFTNYKRHSEQEKLEISSFANAALLFNLLPILDDLARAFDSTPPNLARLTWVDGIRLIGRKLEVTLESQGLVPIEALGQPFDPNFHEAAVQGKGKEGIVVEEIQKGYKIRDRVIRPAMVVVGNGEEEETDTKERGFPEK